MTKIIDFDEKRNEMRKISIYVNESKYIAIKGQRGRMFIELNSVTESKTKVKKSILLKLKAFFKSKKILNDKKTVIKEISEKESKNIFFEYIKYISYDGKILEEYKNLWEQVKDKVISSSNFTYSVMQGENFDFKNSFTYFSSSLYTVKKSCK